jgi:putative nucleotidyltransferase with HDIG domain
MPAPRSGSGDRLTAFALGAAAVGLAWARDARIRRRYAARLHRALVDLLLNTLSAGDARTERHSRRVADLTDALASTYDFPEPEHSRLRVAALLHDLGKIDDRFFHVLHSCAPLSTEERQRIEEHPRQSADILEPLEPVHPGISAIVSAHHECWDGTGYPQGLTREEIPLEARIISVADVFDALTQPRAYRKGLPLREALDEIQRGSGSRFDPHVVERVTRPEVLNRWMEVVRAGRREEAPERRDAGTE